MRIRLIALLGSLFLSACGQTQYSVVVELENYVKQFELDYNIEVNLPVEFASLERPTIGVCRTYGSYREILIDYEFYNKNKTDYYVMHQLVYHELGHCVLGLGHNDTRDVNGYPVSIMNSYAFGHFSYYEMNINSYVTRLWSEYSNNSVLLASNECVEYDY